MIRLCFFFKFESGYVAISNIYQIGYRNFHAYNFLTFFLPFFIVKLKIQCNGDTNMIAENSFFPFSLQESS